MSQDFMVGCSRLSVLESGLKVKRLAESKIIDLGTGINPILYYEIYEV